MLSSLDRRPLFPPSFPTKIVFKSGKAIQHHKRCLLLHQTKDDASLSSQGYPTSGGRHAHSPGCAPPQTESPSKCPLFQSTFFQRAPLIQPHVPVSLTRSFWAPRNPLLSTGRSDLGSCRAPQTLWLWHIRLSFLSGKHPSVKLSSRLKRRLECPEGRHCSRPQLFMSLNG